MSFLARAGCTNQGQEDPVRADMGQEHQYRKKWIKNVSLLIKIIASAKQKYLALLVALHLSLVFGFNNLMPSEGPSSHDKLAYAVIFLSGARVQGNFPGNFFPSRFSVTSFHHHFPSPFSITIFHHHFPSPVSLSIFSRFSHPRRFPLRAANSPTSYTKSPAPFRF
jgi:hypothetical protein